MNKYKDQYPMYSDPYMDSEMGRPNRMRRDMRDNNTPSIYLPSGIQLPGDKDDDFEEDIEYMKSLYPSLCKRIQVYIDEECDRLEYDGSYMYDEYPDRDTVERITDNLCDRMRRDGNVFTEEKGENAEVVGTQFGRSGDFERDLVKILFLNELFGRRRNRFYGGRRRRRYNPYIPYFDYPYYF